MKERRKRKKEGKNWENEKKERILVRKEGREGKTVGKRSKKRKEDERLKKGGERLKGKKIRKKREGR